MNTRSVYINRNKSLSAGYGRIRSDTGGDGMLKYPWYLILFVFILGCSNIRATRHYESGKKLAKEEKFDQAVEELELAVQHNPNHDQALEALGLIFGRLGQFETAVPYFERALRLEPEEKLYLINCALVYEKLDLDDEARDLYIRVLAIDKDNEAAKTQLRKLDEKAD